ncbi:Bifunctional enzyme CysN/CysC [Poriferisphaera corsica]|uniref:Sulfate adenylyltransferase subunit 1 n=1 Tax=Poriferisphaera corsica TaxID=2528020 RepID=A0A517YTB7_9BACT|nr:sulfate adenylyltransferase subunit CysN [Poriferisphaera corsica]QDU33392.1 Bifunctional enzyme CysN/CysC [Poriferisphaera corsica]
MSHQSELIEKDIDAYLAQHEQKELLRLLTCGSVDDGKSTLIGRLLYDSKMIYEDQLKAVQSASVKHGTTGTDFDPALLTDGLKAEREQGITIDVAYRYFSTAKRKFIIADTPGHEQYTRNMATGASTCDLAIILIDARHGVVTQTRRHSFIASLLGIKHVVVAVNKMDLVDYSESVFDEICKDYRDFAAKLDLPDVQFVPMSALLGDNVVNVSEKMPWYQGASMMHILEHVHIASDRNLIDMRFPVQYVNRPNLDFRGFSGTLASGIVRPGDKVMALPSRRKSVVKEVVTYEGNLDEAFSPQAITLTLEDEIDVSRGDMLVHEHNVPHLDSRYEAMVVWMADEPLVPQKQYLIKHTTRKTAGVVSDVRYRINVNTIHREDTDQLRLNEIGRCVFELSQPIAFDAYKSNKDTGSFIIIDRLTNTTVGAGMILDRSPEEERGKHAAKRGIDVRTHDSLVSVAEKEARYGHKPATVWLTGLTGSGKSAIAYALERRLFDEGKIAHVLDARNARLGLNVDLDYSESDRRENLRRAGEVARLMNESGLISICAFLSPNEADRKLVREIVGDGFYEVYLNAPEDVCESRRESINADENDPATKRALRPFFDLNAGYEQPEEPEIELATDKLSVNECVEQVMARLRQDGIV